MCAGPSMTRSPARGTHRAASRSRTWLRWTKRRSTRQLPSWQLNVTSLDQSGNVVMAHPFTTVNLGFSVMGERNLWWGGCAWDSFAIPNLVKDEPSVLVATTCPACRRPLAWTVTRAGPPEGPEVAHFLVPMDKVWNDVVYACSNQRLFCSKDCVQDWLASTGHAHGYIMDLATLWRLASGWYSGRLDSPYQRKDPQGAADYFRGVGLQGPFWGLND